MSMKTFNPRVYETWSYEIALIGELATMRRRDEPGPLRYFWNFNLYDIAFANK